MPASARTRPLRRAVPAVALVLLAHAATAAPLGPPLPPRSLAHPPAAVARAPGTAARPAARPASLGLLPDVMVNVDPGDVVNEFGPAIAAAPDGTVYVVWTGDETQKTVWVARSTDGGATFAPAVRVNDAVAYPPSYSVYQPDIAVGNDGTVYVVWFDYRAWATDASYGSPIDVYLDRSTDRGATWGTDVLVSVGGSGTYPWHYQPYLALDRARGDLYVAFDDLDRYGLGDPGDVSIAHSTDGGASFQPKHRVDDLPDGADVAQAWPALAVAPAGDVYVAFEDARGTSQDIRIVHSSDHAATFGAAALVNADTTGEQDSPTLAVGPDGGVLAAWLDWSRDSTPTVAPFENDIRCARSGPGGAAFGAEVTVNDASMNADYGYDWPPRLAVDAGGVVHVVWFDRRADTTLCWYDRSQDGGATFGTDVVVSHDREAVAHDLPRIALGGGGNPCVAWIDQRNGPDFDVFFTGARPVTDVARVPAAGLALRVTPDPFQTTAALEFTLGHRAHVRLDVRDVQGRTVRVLADGERPAGPADVWWDGHDDAGRRVPAGVYFARIVAGGAVQCRRIVRLN